MKLSDLLEYDDIVVQCHDNPDADAIASGFGVYSYLKAMGKDVRFIYSGNFIITKTVIKSGGKVLAECETLFSQEIPYNGRAAAYALAYIV